MRDRIPSHGEVRFETFSTLPQMRPHHASKWSPRFEGLQRIPTSHALPRLRKDQGRSMRSARTPS